MMKKLKTDSDNKANPDQLFDLVAMDSAEAVLEEVRIILDRIDPSFETKRIL